jgi:multiple sugar transport system ATP-binding protein
VEVGRAIVRKPAAFLFDEPLSNLDARLRVEMRAELKRLHGRLRTTSIYVTHDQVEAMTLGDRVAVMRDGVLQQDGTPLEIYDFPANRFVAGFLGTPPMNFMEGRLEAGNGGLVFALDDIRFKLNDRLARSPAARAGRRVLLGVRPENVRVGESGSPREVRIEARVEVIEPLGDETLLYLRVAGQTLIGKADPHKRIAVNDVLPVSVDPDRVHFFDLETGANLAADQPHGKE